MSVQREAADNVEVLANLPEELQAIRQALIVYIDGRIDSGITDPGNAIIALATVQPAANSLLIFTGSTTAELIEIGTNPGDLVAVGDDGLIDPDLLPEPAAPPPSGISDAAFAFLTGHF